jgi:RimJ/RimL family protein N-acetyltransferase
LGDIPPVYTQRLTLRPFTKADTEPLMSVFGDPEVMRFGDGVRSADWVGGWVKNILERQYATMGFGPLAVVCLPEQRLIGYCGLFLFDDLDGKPEIELGYRLERLAWGNGYATEAASAVRNHAFTALGIARLISMIDPTNQASIRVAEKIGMRYEKEVMLAGYTHPDHIYAINNKPTPNVA